MSINNNKPTSLLNTQQQTQFTSKLQQQQQTSCNNMNKPSPSSISTTTTTVFNNNTIPITPTTPITTTTPTNDFYTNLQFFQQQTSNQYRPVVNSNIYANYNQYRMLTPQINHYATVTSGANLTAMYPPSSIAVFNNVSQPFSFKNPNFGTDIKFVNDKILQIKASTNNNIIVQQSEQDILDNGFLKLFDNKDETSLTNGNETNINTNVKRSSSLTNLNSIEIKPPHLQSKPDKKVPEVILKAPNYQAPALPKDADLIDLSGPHDANYLSLFDPLHERKQLSVSSNTKETINKNQKTTNNNSNHKSIPHEKGKHMQRNSVVDFKTPPILHSKSITTVLKHNNNNTFKTQTSQSTLNKTATTISEHQPQTLHRSFSFYEKANNIDEFLIIDCGLNDETNNFQSFEQFINDLKTQMHTDQSSVNDTYSYNDRNSLTHIAVFSPLLERPILSEINIKLIIKYYDSNNKVKQVNLNASISCTIEHILYETLNELNMNDLNTSKYLFKIHGKEEYLPLKEILCELKYIQDCLCLNKDPIFILIELKNINTQLSHNQQHNEEERHQQYHSRSGSYILHNFHFKLDDKNLNSMPKIRLDTLLKSISTNKCEIQAAVNDNDLDSIRNWCSSFKLKLKHLIKLLYNINYTSLLNLIERIEQVEFDLKSYHSKSEINELSKKLLNLANDSMHACIKFCNCAANSFLWPYKLACDQFESSIVENRELIQSDDNVTLYVESLNNLSVFFDNKTDKLLNTSLKSNSEIYLKCSIFYGTLCLEEIKTKSVKFEKFNKKTDYILFSDVLTYSNVPLCVMPREAVLVVQLCALVINNDNTTTERCLAWSSKAFLDENLMFNSGEFFLSMFPGDTFLTCTTASNIYSNKAPILYLSFSNRYTYTFPEVNETPEFHVRDFEHLNENVRKTLINICNKSISVAQPTDIEKNLIREHASHLCSLPNALSKLYLAHSNYDYASIVSFYGILKQYESLSTSEALELLLPSFPDVELRNLAVRSLQFLNCEALSLYLPQLLESLKYERLDNSALSRMLLQFASKDIRFAHKLYWYLREFKSRSHDVNILAIRYDLLYQGLLHLFSKSMINEINQENLLVERIDDIGSKIKNLKNQETLQKELLQSEIGGLLKEWPALGSCRLPYDISSATNGLDLKGCTFLTSFTVPLKLIFKNIDSTANNFYTLYKIGDDLRQDMFVLQLINIMKQLWLLNNLDLSILTFNCLQTGDKRGFIEMITDAETLKDIQGSAINAFKKSIINGWLKTHNPIQQNFYKAVDNFTKSCAGYNVATYILGIGDRHNDNVMVKYSGHMFHIDFGKYLGDAQMFAGIKRDRTPILFTQDMFYVINQGTETTHRFHEFIDLCCRAFQILRENYNLILTLMDLMIDSYIPGLNKSAIQFVYKNLMIGLNDDEAAQAFTNMINESSKTIFQTVNFAIHALAQPRTSNSSNYFSFVTQSYNINTDGRIDNIVIEEDTPNAREEMFKFKVIRENEYDSHDVYRTFDEFCELYQMLLKEFPALKLPKTAPYSKFKENSKPLKKRLLMSSLIGDILNFNSEIRDSDVVYTFFHQCVRDQTQSNGDTDVIPIFDQKNIVHEQDTKGQIKIKLKFCEPSRFIIIILFARNLKPPNNQSSSSLKPYAKAYLKPDAKKLTKKKVEAVYCGANPIFNQTMEYGITLNELKNRILEISVNDNKLASEKIGSVEIKLADIPWENGEFLKWYDLK